MSGILDLHRRRAVGEPFGGDGLAELGQQVDARIAALEVQNRRLQTALDSMSQGLCMYGADGRLVISNRRACEMSGLPDGAFIPGMTVYEIMRANPDLRSLADAAHRQRVAHYVNVTALREPAVYQLDLPDGRALRVTHEPTPDGGFVDTFTDMTEGKQAEARISHLALHDPLTDLPNRTLMHDQLEEACLRAERGEAFAIICLDVDQFKTINESLGHPVGDQLLRAIAERLLSEARLTDTVARVGGDEFAIIQTGIDNAVDAKIFASRVLGALTLPYSIGGHDVTIGVSVGVAVAPDDGTDPYQLLKNADLALYRAKLDGRGCIRFFQPRMDAQMQIRRLLETDLRKALGAQEFEVYYQPLLNARSRKISGFEALLRWHSPERGMVSPAEFIPLCEQIGLIDPIGEWVLRQACVEAVKWPVPARVAVNVSARQFRGGRLIHTIDQILRSTGLAPQRLEIEVTETMMIENRDEAVDILRQIKRLGVRISMDDFATGFSSPSYLRSFPFDNIKIDQSFVRELGVKRDSTAIIRAVTGLCGSLGVTSTAEGVETEEQLALLNLEQCDEVQGYLFSRARPATEILSLFERFGASLETDSAIKPVRFDR